MNVVKDAVAVPDPDRPRDRRQEHVRLITASSLVQNEIRAQGFESFTALDRRQPNHRVLDSVTASYGEPFIVVPLFAAVRDVLDDQKPLRAGRIAFVRHPAGDASRALSRTRHGLVRPHPLNLRLASESERQERTDGESRV
jgi:hypothetical protein